MQPISERLASVGQQQELNSQHRWTKNLKTINEHCTQTDNENQSIKSMIDDQSRRWKRERDGRRDKYIPTTRKTITKYKSRRSHMQF